MSILRPTGLTAEDLCLACGLCCNGVIFADVQLQPEDSSGRLQALGLQFLAQTGGQEGEGTQGRKDQSPASAGNLKFCQPCTAFQEGRCRIYDQRPSHCRKFECLLLKQFREDRTSGAGALREIRKTQRYAEQVLLLLRQLGDADEQLPLARRFRRTTERFEAVDMGGDLAEIYGRLTVAVLDLNFRVSTFFYPG